MSVTATHITVQVPLAIRRRPGRKMIVTPVHCDGESAVATRADPALLKALARAFRYQRLLDEGRYASITEMAAAEKIERGYLGSLLRLTLLVPGIVEAILGGRQPARLGLPILLEPFPLDWDAQRTALADSAQLLIPIGSRRRSRQPEGRPSGPGQGVAMETPFTSQARKRGR